MSITKFESDFYNTQQEMDKTQFTKNMEKTINISINSQIIEKKLNNKFDCNKIKNAKNIIVVHHNSDIDGNGIAVISRFLDKNITLIGCNIRADECFDMVKKELDKNDLCIIADLNFTEEYAIKVENELDTDKIILLDHHNHALFLNKYKWAMVITHDILNYNLSCGTMLFYYLVKDIIYDYNIDSVIKNKLFNFVYSTAAYDTWFANDDRTSDYSYTIFYETPKYLNLLFKGDKKNYIDKMVDNINHNMIIDDESYYSIKVTEKNITDHCVYMYNHCKIINYNNMNIAICFSHNYVSEIGDFILKKQPEIDFIIIIDVNSNRLSMRSQNRDKFIDVSKIAKDNNGGGHPNAAGFSIDQKTIITLVNNIIDDNFSNIIKDNYEIKDIHEFKYDSENHKFIL